MKYVVFHLETGGLNPFEHSILELGAIVEDTEKKYPLDEIPKFQSLIQYDVYRGDAMALYRNRELLLQISKNENKKKMILTLDNLAATLYAWLSKHIDTTIDDSNRMLDFNAFNKQYDAEGAVEYQNQKTLLINVAGKNFGVFQHRFLQQIPDIDKFLGFNHRFMDPAILFFNPAIDKVLPGTEECKRRAGLEITGGEKIPSAISECWDVICMFRQKLNY